MNKESVRKNRIKLNSKGSIIGKMLFEWDWKENGERFMESWDKQAIRRKAKLQGLKENIYLNCVNIDAPFIKAFHWRISYT